MDGDSNSPGESEMYEELIEKLRNNSTGFISGDTVREAANVIEELSVQNEVLRHNIIALMWETKEKKKDVMSIDEAIYCMKSYLPDNEIEQCAKCPYYGSVKKDSQTSFCRSAEAHRMAVIALERIKRE